MHEGTQHIVGIFQAVDLPADRRQGVGELVDRKLAAETQHADLYPLRRVGGCQAGLGWASEIELGASSFLPSVKISTSFGIPFWKCACWAW